MEHKDVPSGSYLIIESLDRLSRNVPIKVIMLLQQICEKGITVVTLDDKREYTEDAINNDTTTLLVALMVSSRANEESKIKAMRLEAAWENKRTNALDKPLTSICPAWLELSEDGRKFIIIPHRAKIVQNVYRDTLRGIGQHSIAKKLNADGIEVFGRGKMWHRSYISKLLANEAVIGTYVPHRTITDPTGKKQRLPLDPILSYFPSIIEHDVFESVTSIRATKQRGQAAPRSVKRVTFMLASLAKCPACQSTMTRVYKGIKGGSPYLICTKAKAGAGCKYKQVNLDFVQESIFSNMKQLDFDLPTVDTDLNDKWELALNSLENSSGEIANLLEFIQEYGPSRAVREKLEKLERIRLSNEDELAELSRSIGDSLSNRVKNTVTSLIHQCESRPHNIPKINTTLHQLFESVEVDYVGGRLNFSWKHANHITSIIYAFPED